jgi:rod shape-determining protein MreC
LKAIKNKKMIVIFTTIILIIAISFTIKPKENPNFMERGLASVFSPVQAFVNWPVNGVKDSINFFSEMKGYKARNEELIKENEQLREQVRQLENAGKENEELRELMNLKKKYDTRNSKVAQIIAKEPGIWFDTFTINKGANDGIERDMVVLTHKGLVGRVSEVLDYSSKVVSILDVSNQVSARLTKTGDLVTTRGDMNLKNKGLLTINYITSDIPISQGDVIETSEIGGIYPGGIFIGNVEELQKDNSTSLNKYAIVKPGVDFKNLKEVLVISGGE